MKKIILLLFISSILLAQENVTIVSRDSNGDRISMKLTDNGAIQSLSHLLLIPKGDMDGYSSVNKYGRAMDGIQTSATDIWDRADATPTQQVWTAPTEARFHKIASSSTSDDSGGVGAWSVQLYGLTTWDSDETSEIVILNGTDSVSTNTSYVIIHRMKVLSSGASGPNVGNVVAVADSDWTVTAQINASQGQTNMAIYGIPSTKTAYMTKYKISAHNTANPSTAIESDFSLLINEFPDEQVGVFLNKSNMGLITSGNSVGVREYNPYLKITGPAIIKFQATSTTADTEGAAEFDLILVDN